MSEPLTPEETAELFGHPVEAAPINERELQVVLALRHIRAQLAEASERDRVGVNELAGRLKVTPPVVSRMLRSDGDMRVSTAVLWADALNRTWDFVLRNPDKAPAGSNGSTTKEVTTDNIPKSPRGTNETIKIDLTRKQAAPIGDPINAQT